MFENGKIKSEIDLTPNNVPRISSKICSIYPIDNEGRELSHRSLEYCLLGEDSKKGGKRRVISVPNYTRLPEESSLDSHLSVVEGRKEFTIFQSVPDDALEEEHLDTELEATRRLSNVIKEEFGMTLINDKEINPTILNLEVNALLRYVVEKMRDNHPEVESILRRKRETGTDKHYIDLLCESGGLHDLGKLLMPTDILLKERKLNEHEFEIIKLHPQIGGEILKPFNLLSFAKAISFNHHERYNGEGYPRKLKGKQIPIGARFTAFVDVFDALHTSRTYKPGWDFGKIQDAMILGWDIDSRGSFSGHFDPVIVDFFRYKQNWDDLVNYAQNQVYKK